MLLGKDGRVCVYSHKHTRLSSVRPPIPGGSLVQAQRCSVILSCDSDVLILEDCQAGFRVFAMMLCSSRDQSCALQCQIGHVVAVREHASKQIRAVKTISNATFWETFSILQLDTVVGLFSDSN